ncbi:hypothetical protein VTO73DRAFT_1626 [Trametes versicolor]
MNLPRGCSTLRTQLVIRLTHLGDARCQVSVSLLHDIRIRLMDWHGVRKNPASAAGDLSGPLLYAAQGNCRIDRSTPFYDATSDRFGDSICGIPSYTPRIPIRRLVPRCAIVRRLGGARYAAVRFRLSSAPPSSVALSGHSPTPTLRCTRLSPPRMSLQALQAEPPQFSHVRKDGFTACAASVRLRERHLSTILRVAYRMLNAPDTPPRMSQRHAQPFAPLPTSINTPHDLPHSRRAPT